MRIQWCNDGERDTFQIWVSQTRINLEKKKHVLQAIKKTSTLQKQIQACENNIKKINEV